MNWGKGLAIAMGCFILFIITMAWKMSRIETNLVEKDYYEKGQNYDAVAAMKVNFNKERDSLVFFNGASDVEVMIKGEIDSGFVHFYRPSDRKMDFKVRINEGNSVRVSKNGRQKGLWMAKVVYYRNGQGYLGEKTFTL